MAILVVIAHAQATGDSALEVLSAKVPADMLSRYIKADDDVWTSFLSQQAPFVNKVSVVDQTSCDLSVPTNICTVLHIVLWRSRAAWHAIPPSELDAVFARFAAAYGATPPPVNPVPADGDGFSVLSSTALRTAHSPAAVYALTGACALLLATLVGVSVCACVWRRRALAFQSIQ